MTATANDVAELAVLTIVAATPTEATAHLTRSFGDTAIGGRSLAAVAEPTVPR
jgi:hypothetical protein